LPILCYLNLVRYFTVQKLCLIYYRQRICSVGCKHAACGSPITGYRLSEHQAAPMKCILQSVGCVEWATDH